MAQNNVMNLLQSMSNSAASNVSAPVDGLAWLLRKAGVPVPRNALLGSDWMAERGLTKPVPQGAASVAGETLGLLAPMAAVAKAPQIAGGLLQMGRNALAPRTLSPEAGAIVWHGSKDPRWIDRGEAFSAAAPAANMPSKFLWVNPKKQVAETYAGVSELQQWKAANGLGAAPAPTAGVRKLDLADDAKIFKVKDVRKASSELGVSWSGPQPLEDLLDAARAAGYDAVKMDMDGGNIAVLNPSRLKRK